MSASQAIRAAARAAQTYTRAAAPAPARAPGGNTAREPAAKPLQRAAAGAEAQPEPVPAARVLFVNRFFYPDHSATSQLLADLTFDLAARGWDVHVVTSRLRYDDPGAQLPPREAVAGVHCHRVWTSRFGRANLAGRAVDYLTFYGSAAGALWRWTRPDDVVVVETDPPLFAVLAAGVCHARGARMVNWVQDLFPEVAAAYGLKLAQGMAGKALGWLRNQAYRRATVNVALGAAMAAKLRALGLDAGGVRIIPNWSDGTSVYPVPPSKNPLRRQWGLHERFVVGYSGNLGRAHDADTLLRAAQMLAADPSIVFLVIGGGAQRPHVEAQAAALGLSNIVFKPYQPRERLAQSLSVADVHLVSLRPEMEGLIFPSKLYGALAAGRPVIFIGDTGGELAQFLAQTRGGAAVAQGDARGLAQAVGEMAAHRKRTQAQGRRLRMVFEQSLERSQALAKWRQTLNAVAA